MRTARALTILAAAPFVVGALAGVAQADSVDAISGNVIAGDTANNLNGNSTITQQSAVGPGATNESNSASVNGLGFIDQSDSNVLVFIDGFGR
ncbi:hypothetical protein [Streptomyces sp. RFCAC02]|uniref:hypothetical protein n=1 Tax=Streptomyces sp. RFCAC02 TaxID=2499143 RepID=UPI003209CE7D